MTTTARRRLIKDLKKIQNQNDQAILAIPNQSNLLVWQAIIIGPTQTPWQGGTFKLNLTFTQDYPNKPPKVKFINKMFHPNIYNDGDICLDILQNQWSPIYDIYAILTSIRSLLGDPNPTSPANQIAAQLYNQDKLQYDRKVKAIVQSTWQ